MFRTTSASVRFESLESRRQLAADFSAVLLSPVAGAALATGVENAAYVTVTNAGTATGRDARVGVSLFASADDTLDPAGDILLGTHQIRGMSAGESETEDIEFVLPAGIVNGATYMLYARVDPSNTIAENNETNNDSAPVAVTFGTTGGGGGGGGGTSGADLSVAVAAPGRSLASGAEAKVFVSVANHGTAATAANALVELFVMEGATADPATDTLLGSRSFAPLAARQTEVEDVEFTVPGGVTAGPRVIYAVIDRSNTIGESDETNNTSASVAATFTAGTSGGGDDHGGDDGGDDDHGGDDGDDDGGTGGGAAGVDLSTSMLTPTAAMVAGNAQKVYVNVFNTGTTSVTTRTQLNVFLMRGDAPAAAADLLLGTKSISRISGGERECEDVEFVLPASVTPGTYKLYSVIDRDSNVAETDETNNVSTTVDVTVEAGRRDLSGVVRGAVAPASIVQGTSLTNASVSFDISNSGTTSFERNSSASMRAYLRPAGAGDSSQDIACSDAQRESLSTLGKGKSKSKSLRLKMPAGVNAGDYTIVVRLDDGSNVNESDESNNTLHTGRTLRVNAPTIDLSLVSSTFIASAKISQPARASVTLTNLGNSGFKANATVRFFYVDSGGVETAASLVTTRKFDIKPTKTTKVEKVALLAAPTTPGTYTLIARVTGTGDIDGTNNVITVRTFTV